MELADLRQRHGGDDHGHGEPGAARDAHQLTPEEGQRRTKEDRLRDDCAARPDDLQEDRIAERIHRPGFEVTD